MQLCQITASIVFQLSALVMHYWGNMSVMDVVAGSMKRMNGD